MVLSYFLGGLGGGTPPTPPKMKNTPPPKFFFLLFLFKSKIRKIRLIKPLGAKPLEARGEAASMLKSTKILFMEQEKLIECHPSANLLVLNLFIHLEF